MRVVVVGAGLSGLAAAKAFTEKGCDVVVVELQPFIGGLSSSLRTIGFRVDVAPMLLSRSDAERFQELGCRFREVKLKKGVVKPGPLEYKASLGLKAKPWPLKWEDKVYVPEDGPGSLVDAVRPKPTRWIMGKVKDINLEEKTLRAGFNVKLSYDVLVYTCSLLELSRKLGLGLEEELKYRGLAVMAIGYEGEPPRQEELLYHGGTGTICFSVLYTSKVDPAAASQGYYLLHAFHTWGGEVDLMAGLQERILSDLRRLKLVRGTKVLERIFLHKYGLVEAPPKVVSEAYEALRDKGVVLAGRLGLWREMSAWEAVESGFNAAEAL